MLPCPTVVLPDKDEFKTFQHYMYFSSNRSWAGGGGGGGMAGDKLPIYGIVRMCGPLFERCQVYDWPPFFSTKSIWLIQFFLTGIWKAPLFLTSRYMHIFFTQRFFMLLVLLVYNELTALFVKLPAINGYKKINGQYMNGSTFQKI